MVKQLLMKGKYLKREKILYNKNAFILFSFILIYWILSSFNTFYSESVDDAFFSLKKNGWYLLFFSFLYFFLQNKDPIYIKKVVNYSGLISIALLVFFLCYQTYTGELIRPEGFVGKFTISPFYDYNMYILMLSLSLIMLFFDLNTTRIKIFSFYLFLAILLVIAIYVGSRRSIVLYVPILFLFPLSFLKGKNFLKMSFLGLLLVSSIAYLVINLKLTGDIKIQKIEDRADRALSVLDRESNTTESRIVRWKSALDIMQRKNSYDLLIGLGQRSFYSYPEYIRVDGGKDYPHNFALSAFFEGGVLKLISLLMIVFLFVILNFSLQKKIRWFFNSFILLWLVTVSISGEEFFMSKQIYFLFVLLAIYQGFHVQKKRLYA